MLAISILNGVGRKAGTNSVYDLFQHDKNTRIVNHGKIPCGSNLEYFQMHTADRSLHTREQKQVKGYNFITFYTSPNKPGKDLNYQHYEKPSNIHINAKYLTLQKKFYLQDGENQRSSTYLAQDKSIEYYGVLLFVSMVAVATLQMKNTLTTKVENKEYSNLI